MRSWADSQRERVYNIDNAVFSRNASLEYRIITFLLLSVLLMTADKRFGYMDQARQALGFVATPFYWLADTPARVGGSLGEIFVSRTQLLDENARLREELMLSRQRLLLAESLTEENNRLLALQSASALLEQEVLPAEIINVSPDPYSRRVLINKGSRDGVFEGQAVLEANGLMGQVAQVMPFSSWVLLIIDASHVTPVEVTRNGERALARGSLEGDPELDLEFVIPTQDIEVGDSLISSGMGQVYPKNYPVAEVISVSRSSGQPYARIRAKPLARVSSTRHVMLVVEAAAPNDSPLADESASGADGESSLAAVDAAN